MYLFDCINIYISREEKNVTSSKPNNIIKHNTVGISKITIYGELPHQMHTAYVYEYHPHTKEKIDGGFIYSSDIQELHNKGIINQKIKDTIFSKCSTNN